MITELLTSAIQFLQGQSWFGIVTSVIALASTIAAATPTPKPNTKLANIYKVVDFLAVNVGHAKDTGKGKKV